MMACQEKMSPVPSFSLDHAGWANRHTALYYMQLAKVLNPRGASTKLASSEVLNIPNAWKDINELKRVVCAFPTDTLMRGFSRSNDNSL